MEIAKFSLNIDDKLYLYEDFFDCVMEYTIIGIFISKEGIVYHVEAYDEDDSLMNYRECEHSAIGTTVFLNKKDAELHHNSSCSGA